MSSNLPVDPDTLGPTPYRWDQRQEMADMALGPAGAPANAQFARYLAVISRHKWLILALTAIGTLAGVFASRAIKLQYQSQTTLWIEQAGGEQAGQSGPIRSEGLLDSYAWIELLRSYTVLDYVVEELQLFVTPGNAADAPIFSNFALRDQVLPGKYSLNVSADGASVALSTETGIEVDRVPFGQPIGAEIGFSWAPDSAYLRPGQVVEFTVMNPRDIAVGLSNDLVPTMAEDGNFLALSLEGADPVRLANTLNTLATRFVDVAAQLKRAKLVELTEVLEEQRQYAEQNLREAEIALQEFQVNTITLPSDETMPVAGGIQLTRDPVFNAFFDLRISRETLREDREAIERALQLAAVSPAELEALAAVPSVGESTIPALLMERATKRAELRELQQTYTLLHPLVVELQADLAQLEGETIPSAARTLIGQIAERELSMDRRIEDTSGELREIPTRAIEEARLQRGVAIAENLHGTLRQRFEEARLAAASSIPDIRVLDVAVVPYQPISDRRVLIILMGMMGGLGVGVVGTLLKDRIDPRVRYPDQITNELGLPILGFIPTVKETALSASSRSSAAEAFRELRLSLAHAYGSAGPILLTVSSPESGDGKSFVTANLVMALADQGGMTLLIDGDVRRGQSHHLFGTSRTPGLTDYLAGLATVDEILQPTHHPSVFFIGSGTRMPNGPELLGSPAMARLIVGLRNQFSAVVVDSPPLGAGADAYALATLTQNLLLVLRVGQTDRSFTETKLAPLSRLPIRLLGALLNGTPESGIYRHYRYLPGYEVAEEAATAVDEIHHLEQV
jgi:capsular exopolysaccharide synthesis family protein